MQFFRSKTFERASPWIVTVLLIIVWDGAVYVFDVSRIIMPSASESFAAIYKYRVALWQNSISTLLATLMGFGIAVVFGVAMGIAIGMYAIFAAMDQRFTGWATRDLTYATAGG